MMETTLVADTDPTGSKRRTPWSSQLMLRPRSFWTTVNGSDDGGTIFGSAFKDVVARAGTAGASEAGTMKMCGGGSNDGRLAS